jgi:hypothetical protein
MTLQAAAPWDGTTIATSYAAGSGSLADPYQISTPAELAYLGSIVNGGNNCFGKYFILTSDLDLASKSWTPIGNSTTSFRATFDGKSHVISNLNVNVATLNAGLFGSITYAKIMNVGIVGTSTVTGTGNVGGIVGLATGVSTTAFGISGCFSNATVSSETGSCAGGIVGFVDNKSNNTAPNFITNCYSTGNISGTITSGTNYVSGIVGRANGATGSFLTISNSYSIGTITATGGETNFAMGIVKSTGTAPTVTNCYYIAGDGSNANSAVIKTAKDMKSSGFVNMLNGSQTPAAWIADFAGNNSVNNGFPILSWSSQKIK